jgi:serine/threonine-protein kinase
MVCDSLTPRAVLVVGIPGLDERGVLTDVGPPWPATLRRGRMLGDTDGLSPEEIRGDPPSAPSNMYALGALLVRCLTGEPPFPGRSRTAALAAHLAAPPPRVSERVSRLPAALDDVVAAAMAKDPQERYRSAGELIASAARSLGGDLPQGAVAGGDRAPVAGVGAVGHVAARRVPAAPAARSRAARAARGVALVTPAVALIAVGVVAAVHAGGNGSKDNVTRSVTRPAHPPASTVASASLAPPAATGSVLEPGGAVRVMSRGGRSVITIAAERLPPERRTPREAYAVWLYNSRRSAVRLGFVVPPVGAGGRFVNHRDLPPDAARYRRVVVTSEHGIGPLPKGPIVLEGALPLPASPQPPG